PTKVAMARNTSKPIRQLSSPRFERVTVRVTPHSQSQFSGGCMFQVIFTLIAIVGASVHLAFSLERRSRGATIAGTYLLYLLFFYVGLMGVLTAYAHVFRPAETSASIGWSTSPYEY